MSPEAWPDIESALADSDFLMYMASSEAAKSKWVKREIEYWLESKSTETLLIVLTDGDIAWEDQANDFNWDITDAVPRVLENEFSHEPLWVDFRDRPTSGSLRVGEEFLDRFATIAARLHNTDKDQIYGRHIAEHRRTVRWALSAILGLLLLAVSSTALAFLLNQSNQELDQANIDLKDRGEQLALSLKETTFQLHAEKGARARMLSMLPGRENEALLLSIEAAEPFVSKNEAPPIQAFEGLVAAVSRRLLVTPLVGHSGSVIRAKFDGRGHHIVTAGIDGTPRIWDARSGDHIDSFEGHNGPVWNTDFSTDDKNIVTAGDDGTARIWSVNTGEQSLQLEHECTVRFAFFVCEDRRILTATAKRLFLWDSETGKLLTELTGHANSINDVAVSSDGQKAITAADDKIPRMWDLSSETVQFELKGHEDLSVTSARFSRSGDRAITASLDRTVRLWDATTGKLVRTFSISGMGPGICAISPDGKFVAGGSLTGDVTIWDSSSGKVHAQMPGQGVEAVKGLVFSPNGRLIAKSVFSNKLEIWDVHSGFLVSSLQGHSSIIWSTEFSPDGKFVLSASDDSSARLWRIRPDNAVHSIDAHKTPIDGLATSDDGQYIATAGRSGVANVYSMTDFRLVSSIDGISSNDATSSAIDFMTFAPNSHHLLIVNSQGEAFSVSDAASDSSKAVECPGKGIIAANFSRDGRRHVLAGKDRVVRVFDTKDGTVLQTLTFDDAVNSVALSNDNRRLVSGHSSSVRVTEIASGHELNRLSGFSEGISQISVCPRDSKIACVSLASAVIWDLADDEFMVLDGHKHVIYGIEFSPDGKYVATSSFDKTARIWEASNGKLVSTMEGHTERVTNATFSPNCRILATGSWDATVRLWEVPSGRLLGILVGHSDPTNRLEGFDAAIQRLEMTSDGQYVVTGAANGVLKAHAIQIEHYFQWAKSLLPKDK